MRRNFEIVKADTSYLDKFYKLFEKTIKNKYFLYSQNSNSFIVKEDITKNYIEKGMQKGTYNLYLGLFGKKIVGYLLVRKSWAGVAVAHWLAVDKDYQKRGIASSLLSFWEKEALKEGAHKLQLWTTGNDIEFYKNRGFNLGGKFPDSWYGVAHYLFYKTLRKSKEKNFLKEYLKKKK